MRALLSILAVLLCVASASAKSGDKYKISGTLPDNSLDGTYVVLEQMPVLTEDIVVIDSVLVKNGKFTFKGKTATPVYARITSKARKGYGTLVVEPGVITCLRTEWFGLMEVRGTAVNDDHTDLLIALYNKQLSSKEGKTVAKSVEDETMTAHEGYTAIMRMIKTEYDHNYDIFKSKYIATYPDRFNDDLFGAMLTAGLEKEMGGAKTLGASFYNDRLEDMKAELPKENIDRVYAAYTRWLTKYRKSNSLDM